MNKQTKGKEKNKEQILKDWCKQLGIKPIRAKSLWDEVGIRGITHD